MALLLGVAATMWQLAFFDGGDLSAFEKAKVMRSILMDAALALGGLLVLALAFKRPVRFLRRLLRWFFIWRILKRCLLGLAALLILVLLFCAEENWRGRRAWENYRREWEAKGGHFDFASFVPPPVPDEQNFALTPIVASCYSRVMDRSGHRKEPEDTNVVNRLAMNLDRQNFPASTNMLLGSWQNARLTDLEAWQNYYRTMFVTNFSDDMMMQTDMMMRRHMPPAETALTEESKGVGTNIEKVFPLATNEFSIARQAQSPAADVLLALNKFDPAIEELRQAGRLPHSRFPLDYATNNPGAMMFPHYASLVSSASVLRLRAIAELNCGQAKNALADVQLILYLAGSIRNEPLTWSLRVRMTIVDCAIQPIWEGLARHQWSEKELFALERELAGLDATSDYSLALRSHRAWNLKSLDYLRTERMANSITCMCGDTMFWPTLAYRLSPGGWFYMNKVIAARIFQTALPTGNELGKKILSPDIGRRVHEFEKLERSPHLIPDNWALSFIPPLEREAQNCARTQASVDLAQVACALERYRLANGDFPESLDTLAPTFIQKVPHDIINGQPWHYHRTEAGNFLLYSVGWNEKDDGGEPGSGGPFAYFNLNYNGDWVWRYPAK